MANVGIPRAVLEMGEVRGGGGCGSASKSPRSKSGEQEDIAPAFDALKGRAEALYVCSDPLMTTNRIRINTFGARRATADDVRYLGSTWKREV